MAPAGGMVMRRLLWIGLLTVAPLLLAADAEAYEGPWCMRANAGFGSIAEICHFNSFEACRNERSLWGTTAFCSQNPRYLPYWQGRGFGSEPVRALRYKKKHRH
jgi:hypothetical protein